MLVFALMSKKKKSLNMEKRKKREIHLSIKNKNDYMSLQKPHLEQ